MILIASLTAPSTNPPSARCLAERKSEAAAAALTAASERQSVTGHRGWSQSYDQPVNCSDVSAWWTQWSYNLHEFTIITVMVYNGVMILNDHLHMVERLLDSWDVAYTEYIGNDLYPLRGDLSDKLHWFCTDSVHSRFHQWAVSIRINEEDWFYWWSLYFRIDSQSQAWTPRQTNINNAVLVVKHSHLPM